MSLTKFYERKYIQETLQATGKEKVALPILNSESVDWYYLCPNKTVAEKSNPNSKFAIRPDKSAGHKKIWENSSQIIEDTIS